ncbi:histidine phosphatase family protein [Thalassovita sp.]|uniref:SixA phosphatase family protein n=1 Tax=Thalassovita sp. TaxID=1979401 RepID=UPI0029DE64D1|nr:histidine phosphatase family protein [Thalassovita sp.]
MTLRLILMRHAKSDWDDPLLPDHARPLNDRGRASAPAMGGWLKARGYRPDLALVSDATRTRETFAGLGLDCPVRFLPELYHAGAARMLDVLQDAGDAPTVLMLGHNPGIAECAERLVAKPPAHPRFYDYPTCATLVADFDLPDWSGVRFGTGHAVDFAIPREVLGGQAGI